jgi:SAM-dependent methyltransferase
MNSMPEVDAAGHASYDPTYFPRLAAIEDRHFWFRARNAVIGGLVAQYSQHLPPGYRGLEVGCGTGNVLRVLRQVCRDGTVVGMDLFAAGLRFARQRCGGALVQADVARPPFRAVFHLVAAFDVIEHLPDDVAALRDLSQMIVPGGFLFLTVPAHMSLWSYFDEASHHCRRYSLFELREKLDQSGYEVEFISEFMSSIFPLVYAGRRIAATLGRNRRSAAHGLREDELAMRELRITPGINGALAFLLSCEARWITGRRPLLFGTSLVAVARRKA